MALMACCRPECVCVYMCICVYVHVAFFGVCSRKPIFAKPKPRAQTSPVPWLVGWQKGQLTKSTKVIEDPRSPLTQMREPMHTQFSEAALRRCRNEGVALLGHGVGRGIYPLVSWSCNELVPARGTHANALLRAHDNTWKQGCGMQLTGG